MMGKVQGLGVQRRDAVVRMGRRRMGVRWRIVVVVVWMFVLCRKSGLAGLGRVWGVCGVRMEGMGDEVRGW